MLTFSFNVYDKSLRCWNCRLLNDYNHSPEMKHFWHQHEKNWHDNTSFLIYLLSVIHFEIKPTGGLLSFHLKNIMQSKKNFKFVAKWRFNSREILVRQKTIFLKKFLLHIISLEILCWNQIWKALLKILKILFLMSFVALTRFSKVLLRFEFPRKLSRTWNF